MNELGMTAVICAGSTVAGFIGSLTGIGGGVVIVPLLTLVFGVDLRYAIGASLVSVIASSSGSAATFVRDGYTNIRIGMFLEIATTIGAIVGAYIASQIPTTTLAVIFGVALITTAGLVVQNRPEDTEPVKADAIAHSLRLQGSYPTESGWRSYHVTNVLPGFGLVFFGGIISALLGIGGGTIKVPAMDQVMRIPFKVATTTSNFMIGVTAAASVGIYLSNGYIDPVLAAPVMLGVLIGTEVGTRVLPGAKVLVIRRVFAATMVVIGLRMIYKAVIGTI